MASKFGASLKSVGKPSSSSKFSKEEKGKTSVTLKTSKDTKSEKISGSTVASKSKEEEKAKGNVAAKPEEKGKVKVASKSSKTEQKGKLSISSKFSKEEEKGPKGQKTTRTKEEETRVGEYKNQYCSMIQYIYCSILYHDKILTERETCVLRWVTIAVSCYNPWLYTRDQCRRQDWLILKNHVTISWKDGGIGCILTLLVIVIGKQTQSAMMLKIAI